MHALAELCGAAPGTYSEDAEAPSDFLRRVNKLIMQTGPQRAGTAEKQGGIFEISPEKNGRDLQPELHGAEKQD